MDDIFWIIEESRLVAFADQARRLSGRTGAMSPDQIETALKSVSMSAPTTSSGLALSRPLLGPGFTIMSGVCLGNIAIPD